MNKHNRVLTVFGLLAITLVMLFGAIAIKMLCVFETGHITYWIHPASALSNMQSSFEFFKVELYEPEPEIIIDEPSVQPEPVNITSMLPEELSSLIKDYISSDMLDEDYWFVKYYQGDIKYVLGDVHVIPSTNTLYAQVFLNNTDAAIDCLYRDGTWLKDFFANTYNEEFPIVQFANYQPEIDYRFYETIYENMESKFIYTEYKKNEETIELHGMDKDEVYVMDMEHYLNIVG